jgi:hypothetical protein
MTKYLLSTSFIFFCLLSFGQQTKTGTTEATNTKISEANKRISFIIGVGASYIPQTLFQDPAINKTNNSVIIEEAQKQKTNITVGIVYTPYLWKIKYANGEEEIVPKGISFATFLNPVAITKATNTQSFFNMQDFGIGIGYKFAGGVLIMATAEWFGTRQPREWFINEYKSNNKPYLINNAPQLSFDTNDNNIFQNKLVTTFGFKVCYTFDVIKNYYKTASQNITN